MQPIAIRRCRRHRHRAGRLPDERGVVVRVAPHKVSLGMAVAALAVTAACGGARAEGRAPAAPSRSSSASRSRSRATSPTPATRPSSATSSGPTQVNKQGGILGRKVQLKIVDDASSPNQVVTNYQTLITRDKVDLVFGPFSTLLTAPAARVADALPLRVPRALGRRPARLPGEARQRLLRAAGAGRQLRRPVRQATSCRCRRASGRRPPPTPSSTTRSPTPIAERARLKFEAAGIKTVFKEVYPPETADLTPVVEKMAAAKPDMVFAGTQSDDAYSMVNAMVQLGFSPKFLFQSNGANSPVEFPSKVGAKNVNGIFSCGDWFPDSKAPGNQAVHQGLHRQVRRHVGEHRLRLGRGLRGRRGRRRGGEEDRQDRQCHDHQDAALRHVADGRGQPQLGQVRRAVGRRRC